MSAAAEARRSTYVVPCRLMEAHGAASPKRVMAIVGFSTHNGCNINNSAGGSAISLRAGKRPALFLGLWTLYVNEMSLYSAIQ